jgi:MFS superfamily sulfate permease-like transporter
VPLGGAPQLELISFIRRKDEIEMEGRPGIALIQTLRSYQPGWLSRDLSAGLAIAAVGLPSAIAYPAIAGLPPETGLYASILALVGYALFGPSQKLIMGPDAATMIVLAAVLAYCPCFSISIDGWLPLPSGAPSEN